NLAAAAAAADAAQSLIDAIPLDQRARHPWNQSKVVAGRGAVELWSGRFDDAAAIFTAGAGAAGGPRAGHDRPHFLGHLALIEALRGRLAHAEELATESAGRRGEDTGPSPAPGSAAAEVALASVHVDRNELAPARRWQKRADEALHARPDKLLGLAASLVAPRDSVAEVRATAALAAASPA